MNPLIEKIRKKYENCISTSCLAHRCKLLIGALESDCLAILDLDKYIQTCGNNDHKMCDFLVFYYDGGIVVCTTELKGGSIKAKNARDQIQEGAWLAEKILSGHQTKGFYPVLVHNRSKRLDSVDYKLLQNTRIEFQSVEYYIRIFPSGTSLENIFRNNG